jgi:hypothetical protein
MEMTRAGSRPSAQGPGDWFTGTVRIDPLFEAPAPAFGRVQRWGGAGEEIRPGDVVWFAPGEKSASARTVMEASSGEISPKRPYGREGGHWHGASPATAMTHIAIQEKLDGKAVEGMEQVADEQYQASSLKDMHA